ncbi:hypothetical protein BJV82DRAFT_663161 [Fennellomyces sp. T-0311]|nr:hypothetical protein BJV82DRAFT_663161 [Fennellomyces sp. T-0311]
MKAKALYDCTADDDGELSFKEGDILVDVTESIEKGWYEGRVQGTSIRGLFPYNYAEFITEPAMQAIPLHSTSDSSKTFGGHSVSPPNSTLSSTWSVISTKDQDNDSDAFDRVMQLPPVTLKPKPLAEKPSVAPKPSQLKKPVASKKPTLPMERLPTQPPLIPLTSNVASRVRSLSTSATHDQLPVKLPSLYKGEQKGTPIIRPKPYSAKPAAQPIRKEQPERVIFDNSVNENEDDVEDVDGYQLVRPSQVRQRQAMVTPKAMPTLARVNFKPPSPLPASKPSSVSSAKSSSPSVSSVSSPPKNKLDAIPAGSSPAPRLPSRPVSKAGRRSRSSKSITSSEPLTSSKPPPNPKPKPSQFSAIHSPQRAKGRSVSNPPPIQPKPFISKLNNGSKPDVPVQSKPDSIRKPPPALATASKTTPAVPLRPTQWHQQRPSEDTNVKPSELLMRSRSKSNGWTQSPKTVPPDLPARNPPPAAKKTPPPPPPSRPVARYEELFNAIHDEGYVDGQTARIIWKRSKISDETLAKIWEQCDPQGSGLLDKSAFIQGMREIDAFLGQNN